MNTTSQRFTKNDSLMIKGLAILMMLWHHCFLEGRFESFTISFFPLDAGTIINVANFFKICVSLFVFISGFGLYTSYANSQETYGSWVKNRLIKSLSNYWFVVVLCWIVCQIISGRTYAFYSQTGNPIRAVWNMFADLLGISAVCGNNPYIETWWYMSVAVLFIIFAPLVYNALEKIGGLLLFLSSTAITHLVWEFPGRNHLASFIGVFILGMIFAKYQVFEKYHDIQLPLKSKQLSSVIKFLIHLLLLAVCYKLYTALPTEKWWTVKFAIIPVIIILFFVEYVNKIPFISHILKFLGIYSANLYLTHGFVRYTYGEHFIYTRGHFIAILFVLLVISLAVAILIDLLKKLTRYDKLIAFITNKKSIKNDT